MLPEENVAPIVAETKLAQVMKARNGLDEFKQSVGIIRMNQLAYQRERQASCDRIKSLIESHDEVEASFQAQVTEEFPELQTPAIEAASQVSLQHPLMLLFVKYQPAFDKVEVAIAEEIVKYQDLWEKDQNAQNDEAKLALAYDDFRETLPAMAQEEIPPSKDIVCTLPKNPREVTDAEMLADLDGTVLVNPNVMAIVYTSLSKETSNNDHLLSSNYAATKKATGSAFWIGAVILAIGYVVFGN